MTGRELLSELERLLIDEDALDREVLFATGPDGNGLVPACAYVDDAGQAWIDLDVPVRS